MANGGLRQPRELIKEEDYSRCSVRFQYGKYEDECDDYCVMCMFSHSLRFRRQSSILSASRLSSVGAEVSVICLAILSFGSQ